MTFDELVARGNAATITLVSAPACHFCADAEDALAEIAREFAVVVEHVDARSPQGAALLQEHRAAMTPLALLNGQYLSNGRLPRAKLRHLLRTRVGKDQTRG